MVNGALKVRIPNPHKGSGISGALVSQILRQAGITESEWAAA